MKTIYVCGECDDRHDNYDEALTCCPPSVHELHQCTRCNVLHDDEDDAEACCSDIDPSTPMPVDIAALEAAGQMRLCYSNDSA